MMNGDSSTPESPIWGSESQSHSQSHRIKPRCNKYLSPVGDSGDSENNPKRQMNEALGAFPAGNEHSRVTRVTESLAADPTTAHVAARWPVSARAPSWRASSDLSVQRHTAERRPPVRIARNLLNKPTDAAEARRKPSSDRSRKCVPDPLERNQRRHRYLEAPSTR